MKTIAIKLYKFNELSDEAKETAINNYRNNNHDNFYSNEILDSFNALMEALEFWIEGTDTLEIKGKRLIAWLENNLFYKYRIPYGIHKKYKEYMKYGTDYRAGKLPPCFLTGVCYDEDFIEDLKDSVQSKMNLQDSLRSLKDKKNKLIEQSYDYINTDEYISEILEANDYDFTVSGKFY